MGAGVLCVQKHRVLRPRVLEGRSWRRGDAEMERAEAEQEKEVGPCRREGASFSHPPLTPIQKFSPSDPKSLILLGQAWGRIHVLGCSSFC